MSQVSISLIIPTHNRARLLVDALDSVARSREVASPARIEVIVVDNNSSDDTPDIVKQRSERGFPFQLRYVLETRQGVSHARNRGITEGQGSLIAFMDDDQRMHELYIARLPHEIEATKADCIGGPNSYYNSDGHDLPDWLQPLLENEGQYDCGPEVKVLGPDERMLIGGNMVFRKPVLQEIGGYNVNLGRRGKGLLGGEEYEIQERLFAAGYRIVYSPHLIQYHYLRPERLKKSYWWRHLFAYGRTIYRQEKFAGKHDDTAFFLGLPRWSWRSLALHELPQLMHSISGSETKRLRQQLDVCFRLGQIYEARRSYLQKN